MEKFPSKPIVYFLIVVVVLGFLGVIFYNQILGNWKWYVVNKAEKKYIKRESDWKKVFNICDRISANNKGRETTIGYYPNRNLLEGGVKGEDGQFIKNLRNGYPDLYNLMGNLQVRYIVITDSTYRFTLDGMPGDGCAIVYLPVAIQQENIQKKEWVHKLNEKVYVVK